MYVPNGLSRVLLGVRTTGREDLCFPPLRNPVEAVSTSDMMPGSSSKSRLLVGGGYRAIGGCNKNYTTDSIKHENAIFTPPHVSNNLTP